ncbi:hypothetical protein LC087_12200 [Bacillus carboniphilus]|uniref:Uncharacterized protein n=1 Tax=Bacillus carboniphilus TaxID=86663 RepID=A0ABY9JQH3_9BACI|nr:hypothetical protein [Bacillus carboniphilus]WLR41636.1 hypothetical protein LC087_12200 [Bacillus carboniphilus]
MTDTSNESNKDELAKKKAAAAAKAKALAKKNEQDQKPQQEESTIPSPQDPYLSKYQSIINHHLTVEALEEAFINSHSKDVPTLIVKKRSLFFSS